MPRLTLRDHNVADLDRIATLWHESWADTGLAALGDPAVDEYRERLDREDWRIRVACVGLQVVGFMAIDTTRRWVRQIFVAPAFKRIGVGTALIEDARRLMPKGFRLRTDLDNEGARRFYEKLGFRLESEAAHPIHGEMTATYVWP